MSPVISAPAAPSPAPTTPAASSELLDLPVTQIVQHPLNPPGRSDVDEDLAADIRAAGEIYERLVVRPAPGQDGKYELLSGHRRFAAAQHLAMLFVPVRVVAMDDVAAATFLLRANQSRKDLTLVEEAVMVQGLLDLPDAPTQHALAESLGRSDTWVSRRAKIARKPEPVLTALTASGSALTFDEVDVLEEFDDNPGLQAEIAAAHGTHEWNYTVNKARQARRAASFYAEEGAVLRKAGVDVQDSVDAEVPDGLRHDGYLWFGEDAEQVVQKRGLGEGWWARRYQYQVGYTLWRPLTTDELDAIARRDALDVEREAQREAEAAAREANQRAAAAIREFVDTSATLRRDFVHGLVEGKTLDRSTPALQALLAFTAQVAAGTTDQAPYLGGDDGIDDGLASWIGADDAIAKATNAALDAGEDEYEAGAAAYRARVAELAPPQLVLAALAAAVEPIPGWRWANPATGDEVWIVAAWYKLLVALGYEPSSVETEALAGRFPEAES
ncbi:ParB/RepB/Spo0J family partition protein [Cellulosimicrobium sp. I38E]|uniref:ParB/RepB/Spo0J family partition protein n=1 Tax=Cellulosimicrobium sp. I38E TaxID=1393139 RepID=UPI0007B1C0F9|nr:ParB/RepB/Spo0J family partition protein [Cellulosimicrobium sp. I38E]KZM78378.1 hypothetical protein A0J59_13680 [Cellulosimicrobium sp. I38E]